ncbi:MAG: hypothetical protein AAF938_14520 [Myxococcota bacterium]
MKKERLKRAVALRKRLDRLASIRAAQAARHADERRQACESLEAEQKTFANAPAEGPTSGADLAWRDAVLEASRAELKERREEADEAEALRADAAEAAQSSRGKTRALERALVQTLEEERGNERRAEQQELDEYAGRRSKRP